MNRLLLALLLLTASIVHADDASILDPRVKCLFPNLQGIPECATPVPTPTPGGECAATATPAPTCAGTPDPGDPPGRWAGCYVGDGENDHLIPLSGEPSWVLVKKVNAVDAPGIDAVYRLEDFGVGESYFLYPTDNTAPVVSGILSFESGGFHVGNHTSVNEAGQNFCYYAVAEKAGYFRTGTWTGTGEDGLDTDLGELDFSPATIIFKKRHDAGNSNNLIPMVRIADAGAGDLTYKWTSAFSGPLGTANWIQALNSPGVELGTAANALGVLYDWVAFADNGGWMFNDARGGSGTSGDNTTSTYVTGCTNVLFAGFTQDETVTIDGEFCPGIVNPDVSAFAREQRWPVDMANTGDNSGFTLSAGSVVHGNGSPGVACNRSIRSYFVFGVCED